MDNRSYGLYRGDCRYKNPLKKVIIETWQLVFSGTIRECLEYEKENPLTGTIECYIPVLSQYIPKGKDNRNQRYRDRIAVIKKDMGFGGIQKSYLTPSSGRRWQFIVQFANGMEGTVTHTESSVPWHEGEEVIYTCTIKKNETIIKILP